MAAPACELGRRPDRLRPITGANSPLAALMLELSCRGDRPARRDRTTVDFDSTPTAPSNR
jgi:hypothetical protein